MRSLQLFEGMMPMQVLVELALIFGAFTVIAWGAEKLGYRLNKLFQSAVAGATVYWYVTYRIYPPIPLSVRSMMYVVAAIGIWGWVSATETYWKDFLKPIVAVLDAQTPVTRALRGVLVVVIPILASVIALSFTLPPDPSTRGPIELRTSHAAPPASIVVYTPEDFRR